MKRKISAAVGLALVVGLLAGCPATKEDAPEPEPDDIVNGSNTQVIRMPDGFRNLAFTCHGTVGVYVTSRGWVEASASKDFVPLPSSVTAVPGHPACSG